MTDPIPLTDITEGFYATDRYGFVQVRGGPDGLCIYGLSCRDRAAPSAWGYRTLMVSLDSIRRAYPDSRWWPSVDVRPEALAELIAERDRLRAERDETRAALVEQKRAAIKAHVDALRTLPDRNEREADVRRVVQDKAEIARLTGEVERLRAHVRTLGALADLTPEQLGRLLAIEPTPEQVARLVEGA